MACLWRVKLKMAPFGAIPTTKIPVVPGFLGPLSDSN